MDNERLQNLAERMLAVRVASDSGSRQDKDETEERQAQMTAALAERIRELAHQLEAGELVCTGYTIDTPVHRVEAQKKTLLDEVEKQVSWEHTGEQVWQFALSRANGDE